MDLSLDNHCLSTSSQWDLQDCQCMIDGSEIDNFYFSVSQQNDQNVDGIVAFYATCDPFSSSKTCSNKTNTYFTGTNRHHNIAVYVYIVLHTPMPYFISLSEKRIRRSIERTLLEMLTHSLSTH